MMVIHAWIGKHDSKPEMMVIKRLNRKNDYQNRMVFSCMVFAENTANSKSMKMSSKDPPDDKR